VLRKSVKIRKGQSRLSPPVLKPCPVILLAEGVGFAPIYAIFCAILGHLRQAAARTLDDLLAADAAALDSFSSQHCRGFFRHAQYASI
jgi:ferredoxin-NADP reductase